MPITKQISLNAKACWLDAVSGHWKKFNFHFKGIIRAIKQLKIWE